MSRVKWITAAAIVLSIAFAAERANACSATQTQVYQSATSVWCVEKSVIAQHGAFPSAFFAFGDNVIKELVDLFGVPAQGVYTFEASVPNGSAHTGSECCGLGVTVTGDAFYGSAYGATGFWGYLLALHETINDFTGQVTSGWPTDFWADHISAFPNSMDWHIMGTLGTMDHDANLTAAGVAQKARFYPGGDSVDPRVPMFDAIFALPNMGYPGWSRIFGFVHGDALGWDNLGVANPDEKRSEYVAAYVSLGAGNSVLSILQSANVCNGKPDGVSGDPTYTCKQANIDAIATAHCSIAAAAAQGKNVMADRAALKAGSYAAVAAKGACGAGCPAECGCKSSQNLCVAPWLGDSVADGGANDGGGDSGVANDGGAILDAGIDGGESPDGSPNGASPDADAASGCGCRASRDGATEASLFAASLIAALALVRARTRSRARRR